MAKSFSISPKYSFLNLFVWFIFLLLVAPLFEGKVGGMMLNLFFTLVLISSIYTVSENKRIRFFAAGIGVLTITFKWIGFNYPGVEWNVLTLFFAMVFVGLTLSVWFKGVLSLERIQYDRIFGTLCIYLLIGLFWALLYSMNELLVPHSYQSDYITGMASSEDFMNHFNHTMVL